MCGLGALLVLSVLAGIRSQPAGASGRVILAVASTNVYGDLLRQVGGNHVRVISLLSDPNLDPHTYESSTGDARAVAQATLVVRNGLGYDDFIVHLENASPNRGRVDISAGDRLDYHTGDNPHIWYNPATMPRVAGFVADALSRQDPADRAYFQANTRAFIASLAPWNRELAAIRARYGGAPVAVTEPVFDYTLAAMGLKVLTPRGFALAVEEGNDPSPQDVQVMTNLLNSRRVRCFFYNQQAAEPITSRLLDLARNRHIPIVGVYETRPPAMTYAKWMLVEARATALALSEGRSTEHLA